MPPNLPHDEKVGSTTLRIVAYSSPFISSYNVLPCLVDMLRTSFNALWDDMEEDRDIQNNQYDCQLNSVQLKVQGTQVETFLQYDDLVTLASAILQFQQRFTMPGFKFQYMIGGKIYGTGQVLGLQAMT